VFLKPKSNSPQISGIKIYTRLGFLPQVLETRIKNAKKEATYLYDDVEVVAKYSCYNMNTQKFEGLLLRFFSECCLNIVIYNKFGERANPREWFWAPLSIINEVVFMIVNGSIINFKYDVRNEQIT